MNPPLKVTPEVRVVMAAILAAPAESPPWGQSISDATGLGRGKVYPVLDRLLTAGWVMDRWEDPQPPRRPRRRFYAAAHDPGWYVERVAVVTAAGPFGTEREARAAVHAVVPPAEGWSILDPGQCRELLSRACEAAGVEVGVFDARVLDWLANIGEAECAVVADLILRAYEAGRVSGADGQA